MISYKKSVNNGQVHIHPKFLGVKNKIGSDEEASKKNGVMKRNLSYAYSILYSVVYGGRAIRPGDREKYKLMYGMWKDFTPDIVNFDPMGNVWTEVKATSSKDKRPLFTNEQIEKYSFYLLEAMEQGQINPDSRIAIFTYGKGHQKPGLVRLNNDRLRKKIANETSNLVVLPLNLLFSIFRDPHMCTRPVMDHTNSDSSRNAENYWRIYARAINALNRGDLGYFVKHFKKTKKGDKFDRENVLHLDNLVVDSSMFQDNIIFGRHQIQPFPVTVYKNQDPHIWLDSLWENHQYILESLNLNDIFLSSKEERDAALKENGFVRKNHITHEDENGELVARLDDLPF